MNKLTRCTVHCVVAGLLSVGIAAVNAESMADRRNEAFPAAQTDEHQMLEDMPATSAGPGKRYMYDSMPSNEQANPTEMTPEYEFSTEPDDTYDEYQEQYDPSSDEYYMPEYYSPSY